VITVQKEKRYVRTRFSADVLDKAVTVFKDIAEKSGNEIHVERYKVEHDDAEWQHSVLDEFLADYRRYGKDAQVTVSGSGVSLFVLVISRNTSVAVEAIERGDVEKIFGIFEGNLKESHLDEVESSEGKDPKEVTETRSVRISDKIITLRNIQSLGDVLLEICKKEGANLVIGM